MCMGTLRKTKNYLPTDDIVECEARKLLNDTENLAIGCMQNTLNERFQKSVVSFNQVTSR